MHLHHKRGVEKTSAGSGTRKVEINKKSVLTIIIIPATRRSWEHKMKKRTSLSKGGERGDCGLRGRTRKFKNVLRSARVQTLTMGHQVAVRLSRR